jgi:hypothetical protein
MGTITGALEQVHARVSCCWFRCPAHSRTLCRYVFLLPIVAVLLASRWPGAEREMVAAFLEYGKRDPEHHQYVRDYGRLSWSEVGWPGESGPQAPTDPDVNLSALFRTRNKRDYAESRIMPSSRGHGGCRACSGTLRTVSSSAYRGQRRPCGFDEARVRATENALLRNRAGEVGACWPTLRAQFGQRWTTEFTAWARGRPPRGSWRDGWDYAPHLAATGRLYPRSRPRRHRGDVRL